MKKILTLIVMAVAFAMPSQAQFKFGVQGGLNMSNISIKDAADNPSGAVKSKAGFFIGPTVKFSLPIVGLGVDAAALYDQREGKSGDETIKSQSIQIPINLRYGVGIGSLAEIFAFAGPQFGFNVGGKKSFEALGQEVGEWTLKSSNLSANIGIGATVLGHLQVKLNYNVALGKTGEYEATAQGVGGIIKEVSSAKFNAWQISAAYYF
jgi:hypothetical protein